MGQAAPIDLRKELLLLDVLHATCRAARLAGYNMLNEIIFNANEI